MTSIFSAGFLDNIQRIYAGKGQLGQSADAAKGQGFERVLGDLEQKVDKSGEIKGLVKAESTQEATSSTLTNLPVSKLAESPGATQGKLDEVISREELTQVKQTNGLQKYVKTSMAPVKTPNSLEKSFGPEPRPLEELNGPPPTPVIKQVSAQYEPSPEVKRKIPLFNQDEIKFIIETAGKFHGIDPSIGLSVAKAESSFRADAVSSDGHASKGIFQLLDSTAQGMIEHLNVQDDYEPFDPGMNAHLGMGYLRRLHDLFSAPTKLTSSLETLPAKTAVDLEKIAVAAFNTGEGNVARAQRRAQLAGADPGLFQSIEKFLPSSTQTYVERVFRFRDEFAQAVEFETRNSASA